MRPLRPLVVPVAALAALSLGCGGPQTPPASQPVAQLKIPSGSQACFDCHLKRGITGSAIRDWKASKHAEVEVGCESCHLPPKDAPASIVNATTTCQDQRVRRAVSSKACAQCHPDQVKQFSKGKHAVAWVAMAAMPTTGAQPKPIIEGQKGCGGCHRIGLDDGKCDSCHTRHRFTAAEARRPEACSTCHMGFDHPQWEMYSTSKHGAIYAMEHDRYDFNLPLKEWGTGDAMAAKPSVPRAPTCAMCHMSEGNHEVRTAWGFLALRLPEKDEGWLKDRVKILQGLGVLDAAGKPTDRLKLVQAGQVARLTEASWQAERDKVQAVCVRCHAPDYVKEQLKQGDLVVREADRLMAEAIDIVEGLYRDGLLTRKAVPMPAHPDLLRFYEVEHPIEQKLWVMFLEHRMRAFQGAFHMNPDYQHWYGWAEMKRDIAEIRHEAAEIRKAHAKEAPAAAAPAGGAAPTAKGKLKAPKGAGRGASQGAKRKPGAKQP